MIDNIASDSGASKVYEINVFELLITLAEHKKVILGIPFITAVCAAIISLFNPNIYSADTQIFPPQQQSGTSSMLNQLGALSGMAGAIGGIKNPNDIYVAMLKSRRVQDGMIKRFELQKVYKSDSPAILRLALAGATTIKLGKDGIISISVEDQNPQRAALLANGYVEELQRMTQVFAVTEASQRRLFFEKQLLLAKKNLTDAEVELKLLQEKTGIIQLDAQAQQVIMTTANLKAQISLKEVEMAALRTFETGNNPEYIRGQQMLQGLRTQLAKLETGRVSAHDVPEAGLEYIRKVRDLKYAENIYEILSKQFEVAKIDEAKESSLIQVLDKAVVPEEKIRPARTKMVLIATFISFVAIVAWVIISDLFRKADTAELERRIHVLKNALLRK